MRESKYILPALILSATTVVAADKRPNIIVIYADDMGWGDVGYHGFSDIATPNIDALAEGGVKFMSGYTTASVSGPSRAGMMTGVYQQRFSYYGNSTKCNIPHSQPIMAEYLSDAGYRTGMVGKWHLGAEDEYAPESRGFDFFYGFRHGSHDYYRSSTDINVKDYGLRPIYRNSEIEPPLQERNGYLTEVLAEEALGFLGTKQKEPFFLYVAFNAVHYPWQVPVEYVERLDKLNVHHEDRRVFAAMVLAMDDSIGDIVARVEEMGVRDNTLIFFVSDNGTPRGQGLEVRSKDRSSTTMSSAGPFRGFKGDTYEGGIRVPFLMNWQGTIDAGTTFNHPTTTLDIMPTVLAAAGIEPRKGNNVIPLDGVDIIPYIKQDKAPHDVLYWRRDYDYAIREGDWKLAYNDEGTSRKIQLFNLKEDIGEKVNLSSKYPEVAQKLQNKFDQWDSAMPDFVHRKNPTNRNSAYLNGEVKNVAKFNRAIEFKAYKNIDVRE